MKNHTKKTLEDAIPTLIVAYKVMSDRPIEEIKEPQFEIIEFEKSYHILYSWFYGEKYDFGNETKQFDKHTIIINKSAKFIEFVESIVEALDTITENNYNYNL